MASNSFGKIFKVTTWGESHGKAIGVVIDGCPAGIVVNEEIINQELAWRTPGRNAFTTQRKEKDRAEILSGVFEGHSTGAPISLIIWNKDSNSSHYESIRDLLRPGHANYTYLQKYQNFDYRGGGRASGRETACRVAAGAIAKQILSDQEVSIFAYIQAIGEIHSYFQLSDIRDIKEFHEQIKASSVFCPDMPSSAKMEEHILQAQQGQDSVGGLVEAVAFHVPPGWGDPIYEKLGANLAKAMLSIPGAKGFEMGAGFQSAQMKGSAHNDLFIAKDDKIDLQSNEAGGTLGGISTGLPIIIRIPFKPTSSIGKTQSTLTVQGEQALLELPKGSRHDPCIAIRAVPVVEAMFALVLVDAMLMNRSATI
jgi:chorismate synthase